MKTKKAKKEWNERLEKGKEILEKEMLESEGFKDLFKELENKTNNLQEIGPNKVNLLGGLIAVHANKKKSYLPWGRIGKEIGIPKKSVSQAYKTIKRKIGYEEKLIEKEKKIKYWINKLNINLPYDFIKECIERLDEKGNKDRSVKTRMAATLYAFTDMTQKEVASSMFISPLSIRNCLNEG